MKKRRLIKGLFTTLKKILYLDKWDCPPPNKDGKQKNYTDPLLENLVDDCCWKGEWPNMYLRIKNYFWTIG